MGRKIPINTPIHQGWNILWYRSLNDWSQEDLAKESGLSQREISDFEKMSIIPDEKLQKLADAFKTDIKYLRDVASHASAQTIFMFDNHGQGFGETIINNPLETVKEMHESTIAHLIEAHNKYTYSLETQLKEAREELKARK